jgi:DNA-binding transcriptional regulator GbsR (MarR family)
MGYRNIVLTEFKKLESNSGRILSILQKHPSLSTDSISILSGLSKSRTCIVLRSLERFDMIECYHRKTGYWRIKKG